MLLSMLLSMDINVTAIIIGILFFYAVLAMSMSNQNKN